MTITSLANPLVKRVRRLNDGKYRRAEGMFVVDGVQPVWRAVDAGADIEMLLVAPDLVGTGPARRLVSGFEDAGGAVVRVSSHVFSSISDRDGPTGIAAIVRQQLATLPDFTVGIDSVFVGLYETANPGNLGTIIRAADSFGVAGIVLIGSTADPFAPVAVKASMGSLFALPVVRVASADELFAWAASNNVTTIATSARGAVATPGATFPKPSLVLLGSEGGGLPADVTARSDMSVRVPMHGTASSLNLAVAAGILLYLATTEASR